MADQSNNLPHTSDQSSHAQDHLAPPHSTERANEESSSKGGNFKSSNQGTNQRRGSNLSLKGGSSPWRLKYRDFVPHAPISDSLSTWEKTESFQKLIDRANEWLKKTPEVKVMSCETVTWMSHDPGFLGDSEMMLMTKSVKEKTSTYYIRGLRLWLIPSTSQKTCHVSFCDVTPDGSEQVPDLYNKATKKMLGRSSKGQLITVETVSIPVLKGGWNSNLTRWHERVEDDCANIFILRLFFMRESMNAQPRANVSGSQHFKLGFKDIVPIMQEDETYEDYEALVEKANAWLKENSTCLVRIVSMRSVMVQKHDGPQEEIGNSCNFLMPGINNPSLIEFFRILRISYLEKQQQQQQSNRHSNKSRTEKQGLLESSVTSSLPQSQPPASPLNFTFETFTPELVWGRGGGGGGGVNQSTSGEGMKVERMEKMRELFSKVMTLLRNTGTELLGVETVFNPMQVYVDDASVNHLFSDQEIKFLFTVRLYLTHQSTYIGDCRQIRRASFQPPSNQQQGGVDSEGADFKPGTERRPLFLRNVVSRQYKYRWVVLAISAFTCMAIIVVVSVVYSNR